MKSPMRVKQSPLKKWKLQSKHYIEPKGSRRTTTNNNLLLKIKSYHGREIKAHKKAK
jgi:hypothetical protein